MSTRQYLCLFNDIPVFESLLCRHIGIRRIEDALHAQEWCVPRRKHVQHAASDLRRNTILTLKWFVVVIIPAMEKWISLLNKIYVYNVPFARAWVSSPWLCRRAAVARSTWFLRIPRLQYRCLEAVGKIKIYTYMFKKIANKKNNL